MMNPIEEEPSLLLQSSSNLSNYFDNYTNDIYKVIKGESAQNKDYIIKSIQILKDDTDEKFKSLNSEIQHLTTQNDEMNKKIVILQEFISQNLTAKKKRKPFFGL